MKTHLTKVSLALLSTVFLFGCQEQGSGPVGPGPEFTHKDGAVHGKGGGGAKDKGTSVNVTVDGGMNTGAEDAQPMRLRGDEVGVRLDATTTKEPSFFLAINLINTHALDPLVDCVQTGSGAPDNLWAATLFDRLRQGLVEREVIFKIDTTALGTPSEVNFIFLPNPAISDDIRVRDAPTVTLAPGDDINGDFTATFSGGNIVLSGTPTGRNPDHVHLTCPMLDNITFDVAR